MAKDQSSTIYPVIPPAIQMVLDGFEGRSDAFTFMDVYSALCTARADLTNPTPEENAGAWAEVLAFGLTGTDHNEKPWGTYYGPIGSMTDADGNISYFPDITHADETIVEHWIARSRSVKSSVLIARYADLVWDLSKLIANRRKEVEFARMAIDAYLRLATDEKRDLHDSFNAIDRAMSLAIQLKDDERREAVRATLLLLHKRALTEESLWWKAYDILEKQPRSRVTELERDQLIADLECILSRVADTSDKANFDPHAVESLADRLIQHYRRAGKPEEVKRLHKAVGEAFEYFGSMGDAMLAAAVLQTSMDAYKQAGLIDDANRILRLIERANVEAASLMTKIETTQEISADELESVLSRIVTNSKQDTFERIGIEFMANKASLEDEIKESAKRAPLGALIPKTMLKGDRVVAQIGALEDDPLGHLIHNANFMLDYSTPWLGWALDRARSAHKLEAGDFVAWANSAGLFGDGRLLQEGVAAWIAGDHVKTVHTLIPQIELAFRTLVGQCGRPTTKAHPKMREARMVITMGEILFDEQTPVALGPHGVNLVLHFRALYSDPRGKNLRNDMAHGALSIDAMRPELSGWLIHSLILLGAWYEKPEPADD